MGGSGEADGRQADGARDGDPGVLHVAPRGALADLGGDGDRVAAVTAAVHRRWVGDRCHSGRVVHNVGICYRKTHNAEVLKNGDGSYSLGFMLYLMRSKCSCLLWRLNASLQRTTTLL